MLIALATLRRFWPAIPIALLLAALFITRATLATARHEHTAFRSQVELKMSEALTKALLARQKQEQYHVEKATEADKRADDYAGQYRAAVLRTQAAQSAGRRTVAAASGGDPRLPAQAACPAQLSSGLWVSTEDAMKTADLAAYSMAAFEWANSINGETP